MNYNTLFEFVQKLLKNLSLDIRLLNNQPIGYGTHPIGLYLQTALVETWNQDQLLKMFADKFHPNTIYQIHDVFSCNYFIFQLPIESQSTIYACIGPYTTTALIREDIHSVVKKMQFHPHALTQLEQFYLSIPLIEDERIILAILYTFGEYLWGDTNAFSFQTIENPFSFHSNIINEKENIGDIEHSLLNMQISEERNQLETQLMQAIATGQTHKAELILSSITHQQYSQRTFNSLRLLKNYLFTINTLFKMAALNGSVHAFHVEQINSSYASKIELLTSVNDGISLLKEMVRKYCLLVKNYSLKNYSLLVQKVLTLIDYDLTADLGLRTIAKTLNINSSYLSSLFKKETGTTLTEYVNQKRIARAIFLLNSTNIQVQAVAQHCGIDDVNYFTKLFKKLIGKTPREYRAEISTLL